MAEQRVQRRLAAILAADVVGYCTSLATIWALSAATVGVILLAPLMQLR